MVWLSCPPVALSSLVSPAPFLYSTCSLSYTEIPSSYRNLSVLFKRGSTQFPHLALEMSILGLS